MSADLDAQRVRMREFDADEGFVTDIDRRLARFDRAGAVAQHPLEPRPR